MIDAIAVAMGAVAVWIWWLVGKDKLQPDPRRSYPCMQVHRHDYTAADHTPAVEGEPSHIPALHTTSSPAASEEPKKQYRGLTPYQGVDRRFGKFECPQCHRRWTSANSWADMGQECKKCGMNVYPVEQTELLKPTDTTVDDLKKPHPMHLCEKCKSLKRPCYKRYMY